MWRTSAFYLNKHPCVVKNTPFGKPTHPSEIKEEHHKTLCSELKYLYTVITRAKSHLWIYESSSPSDLPMLDYWHRRGVIKAVTESSSQYIHQQFSEVSLFKSKPEDWKRRGDEMREQQLWEVAMGCYQNAGEDLLKKQVYIKLLLEEAAEFKDTNESGCKAKLRMAAAVCLECYDLEKTVKVLLAAAHYMSEAGMNEPSAHLYEKLEKVGASNMIYTIACSVYIGVVGIMI